MDYRFPLALLMLCILSIVVFQACKTPTYTLDALPDEQLRFGSGGGFAGTSTEHLLLANGQYFQKPQQSRQMSYVGTIDKSTAKSYLKRAEALGLDTMNFNHPGNMYYYLQTGADEATRVTWGDINFETNAEVVALYKELIKEVSKVQRELPAAGK